MRFRDPVNLALKHVQMENLGGNSDLNHRHSQLASQRPPTSQSAYPQVILVLGFSQTDLIHLPNDIIPEHASVHFTSLGALTGDVLQELYPTQVVSPLISGDGDAQVVAHRLSDIGFKGCYKVLTANLPRPNMVQTEISKVAPNIVVTLVDMSAPRKA